MPVYGNSPKSVVNNTFAGIANEFVYDEKTGNSISTSVEKINKSVFGNNSSTYFDVSIKQSSLSAVQDSNADFINESGTKSGFVKNLTGLYEMSSYEASVNFKDNNGTTYSAFANIDGSLGAGVKFENGNSITGAYTLGSGTEVAYSTDNRIAQTKTGVFYDKNRNSVGVASIVQKQVSNNVNIGSAVSADLKGNWSASVATNISKKNNNIKLNAGVQNDSGSKSGFIGAIVTF